MAVWFRTLCFLAFVIFIVITSSVSSLQLSDCKEFKVIPPEQYDRDVSSIDDSNKRPLGYMYAQVENPVVHSQIKNPCVYLKNLTSRDVEVMIQTFVPGQSVCVRDDGKPTPKKDCAQGGTLSLACWNPTNDAVIFEFYCDPAEGCDTDTRFWFRLTPSPFGADIDDWCLGHNSMFPQDLVTVPPPAGTKPTVKGSVTSFSPCNFLQGVFLLLVHLFFRLLICQVSLS